MVESEKEEGRHDIANPEAESLAQNGGDQSESTRLIERLLKLRTEYGNAVFEEIHAKANRFYNYVMESAVDFVLRTWKKGGRKVRDEDRSTIIDSATTDFWELCIKNPTLSYDESHAGSIRNFLWRILVNFCRKEAREMWGRRKGLYLLTEIMREESDTPSHWDLQKEVEVVEEKRELIRAMHDLSEPERTVILHEFGGKTIDETVDVMKEAGWKQENGREVTRDWVWKKRQSAKQQLGRVIGDRAEGGIGT